MKPREKATKEAVRLLSMFAGYTDGVKEVEAMLNALSDKDFDVYMQQLRDGSEILPYIHPNLSEVKLSTVRNLEIADELGHNFYERIWIEDADTGDKNLTDVEALIVDLPFRRQQQHLSKKIGIPSSNRSIDETTGQVTGASKGSRLSYPEMQIGLYSQGLEYSTLELFTIRGGNTKANAALEANATKNIFPSIRESYDNNTEVVSNRTLSSYLTAAMFDHNLLQKG